MVRLRLRGVAGWVAVALVTVGLGMVISVFIGVRGHI